MKKFIGFCALVFFLAACFLGPLHHAAAQTNSVTLGGGMIYEVNIPAMAATPICSRAAGCVSEIQICNMVNGKVTTACIGMNGTKNNGTTLLNLAIVETTGTSVVAHSVATVRVDIPAAEAQVGP